MGFNMLPARTKKTNTSINSNENRENFK